MSCRWSRLFPNVASRGVGRGGVGSAVRASWLMLDSSASFRASCSGMDVGCVDLQHGFRHDPSVADFAAILDAGAVPFARIPGQSESCISHALDGGARGLICPMVNSPDQAARLVNMCRYPPKGCRSYGPDFLLPGAPASPAEANDTTVVLAMVETREALENVECIAAVDGLDGIFVGPLDLGLALGCESTGATLEGPVWDAATRIREACHAAGKRVGIYGSTAEFAALREEEGFDLVVPFTDWAGLAGGARAAGVAMNGVARNGRANEEGRVGRRPTSNEARGTRHEEIRLSRRTKKHRKPL